MTGYNSELSNKSFSEKKEFLTNSNINLNRDFLHYDIWNEVSIEKRGNSLFDNSELYPVNVKLPILFIFLS